MLKVKVILLILLPFLGWSQVDTSNRSGANSLENHEAVSWETMTSLFRKSGKAQFEYLKERDTVLMVVLPDNSVYRISINFIPTLDLKQGGVLYASSSSHAETDTTHGLVWDKDEDNLIIGGSLYGTLIKDASSGIKLVQNDSVWPQMTIFSTGLTNNSLPRFRTARIEGNLKAFDNLDSNQIIGRFGMTGSTNDNRLKLGAQITSRASKNWTSSSAPANLYFEATELGTISPSTTDQMIYNYQQSLQLGVSDWLDIDTKLYVEARNSGNNGDIIHVKDSAATKDFLRLRDDGDLWLGYPASNSPIALSDGKFNIYADDVNKVVPNFQIIGGASTVPKTIFRKFYGNSNSIKALTANTTIGEIRFEGANADNSSNFVLGAGITVKSIGQWTSANSGTALEFGSVNQYDNNYYTGLQVKNKNTYTTDTAFSNHVSTTNSILINAKSAISFTGKTLMLGKGFSKVELNGALETSGDINLSGDFFKMKNRRIMELSRADARLDIGEGVTTVLFRPSETIDFNSKDITSVKNVKMNSDSFVYFGESNVNGTWRIGRIGNDLVSQRRESGSWVTKQIINP